jgi:hypothetical protein
MLDAVRMYLPKRTASIQATRLSAGFRETFCSRSRSTAGKTRQPVKPGPRVSGRPGPPVRRDAKEGPVFCVSPAR